jgi:MFS family permease
MSSRAVLALGMGQCVNWGVLYYAFAVLLLPVEHALDVPRWVVAGAFSVALLMSAALAPAVGRRADRGDGALVMQAGGFAAAALLVFWAIVPTLATLYVVWAGLGVCMAATLYEPAFAIVGRAHENPAERLRALAALTVLGGLASTVFLPATALLVQRFGWRPAVVALACVLAASTCVTSLYAPRRSREPDGARPAPAPPLKSPRVNSGNAFLFPLVVFSLASFASAAFTTNLVPALGERAVAPATAAALGGLLGVMQLPGRALLMHAKLAASPFRLLVVSLALQAVGLLGVATAGTVFGVAGAIALFAVGAGLATLVRPYLVQTVFTVESAGYLNGRMAQSQQLARAAGPIVAAWAAGAAGYGAVFAVLAAVLAALAVAAGGAGSHLVPSGEHLQRRVDDSVDRAAAR